MPFGDPIVAGATLVRDAIQSEDYQPGVSGWIIRRDGSAEFNTGTYRGAVVINDADGLPAVTIDADGMRVVDNPSGSAVQLDPKEPEGAILRLTPKNSAGFTWLPGKLFASWGIYPGPVSNPRGYTSLISAVETGRKTAGVVAYGEGTQPNEPPTVLLSADQIDMGTKTRPANVNIPGSINVKSVPVRGAITAFKSSEPANATADFYPDPHLILTMPTGTVSATQYALTGFLPYRSSVAGGFKFRFMKNGAAIANLRWTPTGPTLSDVTKPTMRLMFDSNPAVHGSSGGFDAVTVNGNIYGLLPGDTIQLEWAQNTADATYNTFVVRGSWLKLEPLN